MKTSTGRRGYALVMVLLFLTLFMGLWGIAGRQIGTMLRIEQARVRQANSDAVALPAMSALAQGLAALEVGYPPSSPYVVVVGNTGFTLAYTLVGSSDPTSTWSVQVAPNSSLLPPTDPNHPLLDTHQFIPQHP
jgi:hypothetical protein